jgi:atypical dual specificity phosphatase
MKAEPVFLRCAEHAGQGELTYVHCKAGRGRSTTLVICYLIREMRMSPEKAYAFVRNKRPQVCLAEGQWNAVKEVSGDLGAFPSPGCLSWTTLDYS